MCIKNNRLWFVEVKGASGRFIDYERVSPAKRKRVSRSAEYWLMHENCMYEEVELVACFVTQQGLDWITNAFDGE